MDEEQQVPPLRYAPVGMTLLFGLGKRTSRRSFRPHGSSGSASISDSIMDEEQQVPPLRYAPVGMTLLFGADKRTSRRSFRPHGSSGSASISDSTMRMRNSRSLRYATLRSG